MVTKQMFLELPQFSDYEREYGFVDYKGKVVLDVGADYGTTAAFFLRRGAVQIVAVEGDETLFSQLRENVREVPEVIPVKCLISSPWNFENLIMTYRPDILKADCEGAEAYLFDVEDRILRKVPEYIMETHTVDLFEKARSTFQRLDYKITHANFLGISWTLQWLNIIHAITKDYWGND